MPSRRQMNRFKRFFTRRLPRKAIPHRTRRIKKLRRNMESAASGKAGSANPPAGKIYFKIKKKALKKRKKAVPEKAMILQKEFPVRMFRAPKRKRIYLSLPR
jgi:hypothetical protein